MDPTPPTQPTHSSFATTPTKKSMSFFLKSFLFALFGCILFVGGYYLGTQYSTQDKIVPPTPPTATPTIVPVSTTPEAKNTKTVKAGLAIKDSSFVPYAIDVPEGWTDVQETTVAAGIDKLTLTKTGYSLTIYQAAIGGGGCLYPGDAEKTMATKFSNFKDIQANSVQFRRSWDQPIAEGTKTTSYTICQKTTDGSYGNITNFGVITAVAPNPENETILSEIDMMIASLKNQ